MLGDFFNSAAELLAGAAVAVLIAAYFLSRRKQKRCKRIDNIFY